MGKPSVGVQGIQRTTDEIMASPAASRPRERIYWKRELEIPGRKNRPQDPNALPVSQWPKSSTASTKRAAAATISAPQTVTTTFDGVTGPTETGAFPPDSMGAVGPSQFFIFINGRLRTFDKATGIADGVVNANPDVFFASVMTPESPPALNFTSDPQIRYDRLSGRWILTIIDVPSSSGTSIGDIPNRLLLAVSNAASAGVISASTVWTFYFVQQDMVGNAVSSNEFLDYPSLGIDNNALYVGGNMFGIASSSFNTTAFVIRKSSILSGGPVITTAFRNLITGGDGPDSPRGVDNYNPTANEGYFIGPSDAVFGRLIMRRVGDPGGTPVISANISITVSATSLPRTVAHLGNTGGSSGNLDALDDRLFATHIRNGRLWTAHNIAVNASGVASALSSRRDAVRWYELDVPVGSGTPTVVQSGTVFDTASTLSTARQYWIPSVMVSGQGHVALGFSTAGTPFRVNAATNGRLAGDTLGALGAVSIYTSSSTAYNPVDDPGGSSGRRWGDYSFTSLDPNDDMTMWTIQEFCDGTDTYGLQVAKLPAPPPATPVSAAPSNVLLGQSSVNVVITGTSTSGSGFFDPGAGFSNRIAANVTGGVVVNSVTYTDPTHVTLNLNTNSAAAGAQDVTIINPDGQAGTDTGIINIPPALIFSKAGSRMNHLGVQDFDVDLPLSGPIGIECRNGAGTGDYALVFTFSNTLASVGSVAIANGTATFGSSEIGSDAHEYLVHLQNVTNIQTVTVDLHNVTDAFGYNLTFASASMNLLIGDVTGDGTVLNGDIGAVKSQVSNPVTQFNFRKDVNADGQILNGDIGLTKAHVSEHFQ